MKIVAEHVTLRNVIIYHAANAIGIYGYNSHNLTLENVKVISYGNPWGANPCPSRRPFLGQDCTNIKILGGENTTMTNVLVDSGSRGISCVRCPNSVFTSLVALNARGPYAGGSALQFTYSDNSIVENFSVLADLDIAWQEDSFSVYRSSNFTVRDGVIHNNNAPTGMCLMFEGSK